MRGCRRRACCCARGSRCRSGKQCGRACPRWRWLDSIELFDGFWGCVHIRCCGHGHLRFRSYSGSLSKSRSAGPVQSNQSALAPPLGASPRLGFRPSWFNEAPKIKSQIKNRATATPERGAAFPCGSGLARECGVSVNISITDPPHSRASPLPQGGRARIDDQAGCQAASLYLDWAGTPAFQK